MPIRVKDTRCMGSFKAFVASCNVKTRLNEVREHVETGRGTETKGGTKIPNLAWNGFAEEKREKNGRFKRAKVSWSDHVKGVKRALEAGARKREERASVG